MFFHLMDENHPDYCVDCHSTGIDLSKYDALINYMNILEDFKQRLKADKVEGDRGISLHKPAHSQIISSKDNMHELKFH
jgi:hypothetical protein